MNKLSRSLSSDDDDESDGDGKVTSGSGIGGFGHFFAGIVVIGLLIGVWRIVSRNGGVAANGGAGMAALGRRFTAATPQAAPSHPGVIALCDRLAGLERRLAQVETHVTSREFELNRKFRDIDAGTGA